MIRNAKGLIKNSSFPRQAGKALQIIEAGLSAVDAKGAVKKARLPNLRKFEKVYVIGFGKASAEMAEALEKRLGKRIEDGAVVSVRKARTKRIRSFVGTHPIPSKKNIVAAKEILSIANRAGSKDLVICLVSGGGSALLALPAKPVCSRALERTNEMMLKAKMPIREINVVRKHISAVKGGQLMKAVYPARLHALVVSDVVGDDLGTIASGPTIADRSTFKGAIAVLKKCGLWKRAPSNMRKRLSLGASGRIEETPKPGSRIFKKARNEILLNNRIALEAIRRKARALGFNASIYSDSLQGEARRVGKKLVAVARKKKRPLALIAGGETIVRVVGKGKGGRNQEMVLGVLPELEKLKKAVFVSAGSDGIDGNSKAAGAIADSGTLQEAFRKRLNPTAFLQRNDSNAFFKKVKGEIRTGPTGTNVMDLHLLLTWN